MNAISAFRYGLSAIALGSAALIVLAAAPVERPEFVQNGEAGFVVSFFEYALSESAAETGACPNGMTDGPTLDELGQRFGGVRGVSDAVIAAGGVSPFPVRANAPPRPAPDPAAVELMRASLSACENPAAAPTDPNYRTVVAQDARGYGIDLDQQVSRADRAPAPNTCAHDDITGFNGERGVDNQFFRAVGCSPAFQPNADGRTAAGAEMLTGAWGILIRLRGVDDIRNDEDVEVSFFANADPIETAPTREPLANATYSAIDEARYRATTRGRVADGVLTTDPVDVRFISTLNALYSDRPLRRARLHMTLSPEGTLDGFMAGYTPVDDMYDVQYGHRSARDRSGALSRLRTTTALGGALIYGYSCNGAYQALAAAADGDPDPETGRCTSISTQYRVRAIPAFIIAPPAIEMAP